jgi:hypothetical protein
MIFRFLDRCSKPVVVEFLQQLRKRGALHILLVQRLDGGKTGSGSGSGSVRNGHRAGV